MTGSEYEQFVRAVLAKQLKLSPSQLLSKRVPGASLPDTNDLEHQIDLMYFQENDIANYFTIIECKYRASGFVDQPDIQNLAFVKENIRAHKAIMVTNNGFTSGATAIAESQRIALLVIKPNFEITESYEKMEELFALMQKKVLSQSSHKTIVCLKLGPDPNDKGSDLIEGLLSDPEIAKTLQKYLSDPGIRTAAERLLGENPEIARAARKFLGRRGW